MQTNAIKLCDPDTPEWLEKRNLGIGASECAAALGLSKWCSARELYHRKRGELPPVQENLAMRVGKAMEPLISSEFMESTGYSVTCPIGMFQHQTIPYMLATPDADIHITSANVTGEWKSTTNIYLSKCQSETDNDLPIEWRMQAQHQMAVLGTDAVYFGVLIDKSNFQVGIVERDDSVISNMLLVLGDFWERVQAGDPPDWDGTDRSLELVRALNRKVIEGEYRVLSKEAMEAFEVRKNFMERIQRFDAVCDKLKAKYESEIGEAAVGILPDGSKMIRRAVVDKAGYTVKPKKGVIDVRVVNLDDKARAILENA